MDPTIRIINPFRPKPLMVQKTLTENQIVHFNASNVLYAFIFDPSGSYGNCSVGGSSIAMPDWGQYTGGVGTSLYNQYKVTKIKMTFRYLDTDGTSSTFGLWMRYNYDPLISTPTLAGVSQLNNVKFKTFTAQSPVCQYTVYPRVHYLVQGNPTLNTPLTTTQQSLRIAKMGWTDVNFPSQVFGMQIASAFALGAAQFLEVQVEYHVKFRYVE